LGVCKTNVFSLVLVKVGVVMLHLFIIVEILQCWEQLQLLRMLGKYFGVVPTMW